MTSRPLLACILLAAGLSGPALAQPTEAQMNAIKSNCRSDYMAKCMSVKPGGPEAFQCLKKNEASLSAACKTAVNAIGPASGGGSAPAQEAKPAAAPAPVQAAPAQASPAPASPPPAAAAPAAAPAVAAAPAAPKPAKPAAPKPAVAAVTPPAATPAAPSAAMPAPRLDSPREARLIREFCFSDFRVLCKGVQLGQGRALQCLAANTPALSPGCKAAMAQASR